MTGQRQLVVVVDDDRATNELICELLAEEGYQTIGAQTGAEGFEIIQQAQPALVITDLVWNNLMLVSRSYKSCD